MLLVLTVSEALDKPSDLQCMQCTIVLRSSSVIKLLILELSL